MRKAFVRGCYGYRNLGDDYILYSMLDILKNTIYREVHIEVYDKEKEYNELKRKFPEMKINFVEFPENKIKKFLKRLTIIKDSDCYIIGGGGLFTGKGVLSLLTINFELLISKIYRTHRALYGVEVNSLCITKIQRYIWNLNLSLFDYISVRNKESKDMLIKCKNVKIEATADMTFGLETDDESKQNIDNILKNYNIKKKYILWGLAMPFNDAELRSEHFRNRYNDLCNTIVKIANNYADNYINVFLPFLYENDIRFINDVVKKIKGEYVVLDTKNNSISLSIRRLFFKKSELNICMRFHSVAFSIYNSSKFIAISYSPKTTRLLKELGLDNYIEYGIRSSQFFFKEFDLNIRYLLELINKEFDKKSDYDHMYCIEKAEKSKKNFIKWLNDTTIM
ncbi:hypothetical protein psyc5s11_31510 [Clostridium gelidum]|uniref:Polysaccharide pyruvyl transferase domain-containing protein n=1 Tax=Clostridium gelidum TaxID=704125 RepID=A0ABN6J365_9CLOT|nr:polysaccharide pyruvyl transferase family protein [Clostridium gelidum]BCZ47084.1 hypothetical protein psyc5s11_31510 [Clostridium gelidum]